MLESAELKDQLYRNFKDAGLLDNMKVTLRKTLLDKLQAVKPESATMKAELQQKQKDLPIMLRKKFQDMIVWDYLQSNGYEYTGSIFLPEASIQKSEALSTAEMCRILQIGSHQYSDLHKIKPPSEYNLTFLDVLIQVYYSKLKMQFNQSSTQTDMVEPLSKKLEDINRQYMPKLDYWRLTSENPVINPKSVNQQIDKARKDTEERLRAEFQHEKTIIRNQLEARIKIQESDRHYKLMLLSNRQKDAAVQKKYSDLKKREKQILESLERKRKECEQQVVKIRQKEQGLIKAYEFKNMELEKYYEEKTKGLKDREKELEKLEMQCRIRKREYEDSIRMVKNRIVDEASHL